MAAAKPEEHVDFIAKPGVTIYHGSNVGWESGKKVRLPKSHAEALAHLRAEPAPEATAQVIESGKPVVAVAKKPESASAKVD